MPTINKLHEIFLPFFNEIESILFCPLISWISEFKKSLILFFKIFSLIIFLRCIFEFLLNMSLELSIIVIFFGEIFL
jgi:hypothetical protein